MNCSERVTRARTGRNEMKSSFDQPQPKTIQLGVPRTFMDSDAEVWAVRVLGGISVAMLSLAALAVAYTMYRMMP